MKYLCCICKKKEGVNMYAGSVYKGKKYVYKICHKCSKKVYTESKERIIKWQENNKDRVREIKRNYARTKRKLVSKKQDAARASVFRALKKGILNKEPCRVCGAIKVQGHHDNYDFPLKIKWFCSKHHREYEEKKGLRKKKYQKLSTV